MELPVSSGQVTGVRVFFLTSEGGNPVPLVADASGMSEAQMQALARHHGHESAFVLPSTDPLARWRLRFFVPGHEMEMCGHATVGALWALRKWGAWSSPDVSVQTLSGRVDAHWDSDADRVWVSQPPAVWNALTPSGSNQVKTALGLEGATGSTEAINASTSRVKTLIQLATVQQLDSLAPELSSIRPACEATGSTGLYPYAITGTSQAPVLFARQFPRASGYAEDAATGIAAAALWGYLVAQGRVSAGSAQAPVTCVVRQGDAMGQPSAIQVRPRFSEDGAVLGCWLSGNVDWMDL